MLKEDLENMKNALYALLLATSQANAGDLPANILGKIPDGYSILSYESGALDDDGLADYLVVLNKPEEATPTEQRAPLRPLLLFTQRADGSYDLRKRNDHVAFRIDAGGQCDPFGNDARRLTIKNRYFTIENGVACGQHWTDYITFRYDKALKDWVFHKRIVENWKLNDSQDPEADALVRDVHEVTSAKREAPIRFEDYRSQDY